MTTLDVAVSTLGGEGLQRVARMSMPRIKGVRWLVSVQKATAEDVPQALLERPDVDIVFCPGTGLSRNRNNAIGSLRGDVMLVADDDVDYTEEGLRAVIEAFDRHSDIAFGLFQHNDSTQRSLFPAEIEVGASLPSGLVFSSIDIAVRTDAARDTLFDTRFGIGSGQLSCGEELVWVLTLRRKGLKGRYFPKIISTHYGPSTGQRRADKRIARAEGVYIAWEWPLTAPLRIPLKAWRMSRAGQMPLLPALASLARGWMMSMTMPKPWK